MKKIVLLVLLSAAISCTDESSAERALYALGFEKINFTGYSLVGCGQNNSDYSRTGFEATNSLGKKVSGVVCCGWFKHCTVRVD